MRAGPSISVCSQSRWFKGQWLELTWKPQQGRDFGEYEYSLYWDTSEVEATASAEPMACFLQQPEKKEIFR